MAQPVLALTVSQGFTFHPANAPHVHPRRSQRDRDRTAPAAAVGLARCACRLIKKAVDVETARRGVALPASARLVCPLHTPKYAPALSALAGGGGYQ